MDYENPKAFTKPEQVTLPPQTATEHTGYDAAHQDVRQRLVHGTNSATRHVSSKRVTKSPHLRIELGWVHAELTRRSFVEGRTSVALKKPEGRRHSAGCLVKRDPLGRKRAGPPVIDSTPACNEPPARLSRRRSLVFGGHSCRYN